MKTRKPRGRDMNLDVLCPSLCLLFLSRFLDEKQPSSIVDRIRHVFFVLDIIERLFFWYRVLDWPPALD